MKTIYLFSFLLLLLPLNLFSQDDLYYSFRTKSINDTLIIKDDITNIQYSLRRYYEQRQTGITMCFGGTVLALVSPIANAEKQRKIGVIAGGIIGVTGFFITLNAEKWLKKASISISPGGVKINF